MTAPGAASRDKRIQAKYGITAAEYDALAEAFDGKCWICQKPVKPGGRALHLDHDHKKKGAESVRGRVCWRCNGGLRWFLDNPGLLRAAANYLESPLAQDLLRRMRSEDVSLPAA